MEKKILVYQGKYGDEYIDYSDKEAAFRMLFEKIREHPGYSEEYMNDTQKEFYKKALSGDVNSIYRLVCERVDYEYEGWEICNLQTPETHQQV